MSSEAPHPPPGLTVPRTTLRLDLSLVDPRRPSLAPFRCPLPLVQRSSAPRPRSPDSHRATPARFARKPCNPLPTSPAPPTSTSPPAPRFVLCRASRVAVPTYWPALRASGLPFTHTHASHSCCCANDAVLWGRLRRKGGHVTELTSPCRTCRVSFSRCARAKKRPSPRVFSSFSFRRFFARFQCTAPAVCVRRALVLVTGPDSVTRPPVA